MFFWSHIFILLLPRLLFWVFQDCLMLRSKSVIKIVIVCISFHAILAVVGLRYRPSCASLSFIHSFPVSRWRILSPSPITCYQAIFVCSASMDGHLMVPVNVSIILTSSVHFRNFIWNSPFRKWGPSFSVHWKQSFSVMQCLVSYLPCYTTFIHYNFTP